MRWSAFTAFVVFIVAYPLAFSANYLVGVGIVVGVMAVATVGFILLIGYARQLAIGQAAFCMIGGYGSALLCTRAGVDPMVAMLLSAVVSMAVAFVIGLPILRLRGYALAMASLSFQLILQYTMIQTQSLTGGAAGVWVFQSSRYLDGNSQPISRISILSGFGWPSRLPSDW